MRRWLLVALAACGGDPVSPASDTQVIEVAMFPATPVTELDLLFMIDDTTGADMENTLARDVVGFLEALAAPGLPSLHVGVATSDLGTSGSLDPANPAPAIGTVGQGGCAGQGDDGVLQTTGASVTGSFVIDEHDGAGGRRRNYDGTLQDVLGTMLRVGSVGCGFEQPLSAIRRALARDTGFLRPSASLAVVILADEDDCSVRDAGLFSADEGALGPLSSFRCTSQGVACDEAILEPGAKTNCRARVDSPYVEDPAITRQFLDELQPRPERLTVASIVGDPAPVAVDLRTVNGMSIPLLAHSCAYPSPTGPQVADPAVRTGAFVDAFASRGARASACTADYAPALAQIGTSIKRSLGIACIDTASIADSLGAPGVQPACEARDVHADGTATPLPRCPGAGDCFDLVADPIACAETADHVRVVVTRTEPPAVDTRVEVYCEAPVPDGGS